MREQVGKNGTLSFFQIKLYYTGLLRNNVKIFLTERKGNKGGTKEEAKLQFPRVFSNERGKMNFAKLIVPEILVHR